MNSNVERSNDEAPYNIVVCSDGTWAQGGSVTPTNVWRTYLCVDSEQQVKIHDDGVGTGGFRLARILGGATGYGISRNLRELIFQLSLAYKDDAKIFLFGFSRGAYTVRILANLICMFGVPKSDGLPPQEVRSLAADLLRAYKHGNELRARGIAEGDYAALENDQLVAQLRQKCHYLDPSDVKEKFPVHFLGCWDTVAALGVPFQPLKDALMDAFPLSFQNNIPGPGIQHLYQALALDEERHTFHAIPWELPENGQLAEGQIMEQVWFPGCHSHVGGSYPKDQLALEALEWMLEKAADRGLRLNASIRTRYRDEASGLGQMVDSRSGFSRFYRYYPREISKLQRTGNYTIHATAVERIASQTNGYTCQSIDVDKIHVVDNRLSKKRSIDLDKITTGPGNTIRLGDSYQDNIKAINTGYMQLGRLLYFVGLIMLLSFLGLAYFWRNLDPEHAYHAADNPGFLQSSVKLIGAGEHLVLGSAKAMVPEFVGGTIVKGLMNAPGLLTLFAIVYGALLYVCARLRLKMQRLASNAWHQTGLIQAGTCETRKNDYDIEEVNVNRISGLRSAIKMKSQWMADTLIEFLLPLGKGFGTASHYFNRHSERRRLAWITALALLIIATIIWGVVPSAHYAFQNFHAYEKQETANFPAQLVGNQATTFQFKTSESNFPTGYFVEEDQEYQITVVDTDAWKDLNIAANPDGVEGSIIHRFRRDNEQPLFKVMGQIGDHPTLIPIGRSLQFKAHANGHLFLFVNDVSGYYGNNQGTAQVTIQRIHSKSP